MKPERTPQPRSASRYVHLQYASRRAESGVQHARQFILKLKLVTDRSAFSAASLCGLHRAGRILAIALRLRSEPGLLFLRNSREGEVTTNHGSVECTDGTSAHCTGAEQWRQANAAFGKRPDGDVLHMCDLLQAKGEV